MRAIYICILAVWSVGLAYAGATNELTRLLSEKAQRLRDYEIAKYAAALTNAAQTSKQVDWAVMNLRENCGPRPPQPLAQQWWQNRHAEKLKQIANCGGKIDIVFLGDSICHGWEGWDGKGPGHRILEKIREKYSVLVAGFGGDRTYHAIWRVLNGELDGYKARVVTILIGTNNWMDNTVEETAADIRRLVEIVRAKQPGAKVLLMPILPRNDRWAPACEIDPKNNFKDRKNGEINRLIADIPDGVNVFWLDLRTDFAGAPKSLMKDGLHPNRDGYAIWWERMRPYLEDEAAEGGYREIRVTGEPFEMPPLREFVYPERRFPITDFGAKADGSKCTAAIAAAIERCNATGGGYVVVPRGTFVTGKIHFKSNVNLRLEEGAVLAFTDEKADYLPAVHTTWEGVECWNTSPLVYAYDCENVAVTGPGTLAPCVEGWFKRASPPEGSPDRERRRKAVQDACRMQYMWGSTNASVAARSLLTACPEAELRPQLIQMNRCRNVLLDGFRIRDSPFWCIHLYHSENVIARNLDMKAMRANNDAFDIDMTRNVLIENCTLENSDDGFCMKAGRNQDAWRLNRPTENVVVRNCHVKFAHTLLGIGSELSGGIRNVSLHDCTVDEVFNAFFVKTNCRRGGFVDNIHCRNVTVGRAWKAVAVDTDVMYQYRNFPAFEERPTKIGNLEVSDFTCREALAGVDVKGCPRQKIRKLTLNRVKVERVVPEVCILGWKHAAKSEMLGQAVVIRNVDELMMDGCAVLTRIEESKDGL